MGSQIIQLTAADFQDAMDFLNLVFGAHAPHDFEHLRPAVYRPTDELMACNYAIREDGRIRAIVGMYPMRWQVGDTVLSATGIGGVSTHPKSRGAGHMKRLMEHCVAAMGEQGVQLSHLGGQRQRYAYYGYERCGHELQFNLNRANLRHCFGADDPAIRFAPLAKDDDSRLEIARALHDAQPAHCVRSPDSFPHHLRNRHGQPHVALDAAERMVGYLVTGQDGKGVSELCAQDDELYLRILRAWVAQRSEVSVSLSVLQMGRGRRLADCCERLSVQPTGNWQIFDWPAVVGALLQARALAGPLAPGCVRVGIDGVGVLELRAAGSGVGCSLVDDPPYVRCARLTAMRLLFGPTRPSEVVELPAAACLLDQWCPLPLHWPSLDGV